VSYKVVAAVFDNGPADPTELLVLLAIAENANDAGHGFPGVATIARRARCCERHASRLIKKMAVGGWLVILPKSGGFGKKQTAYQLNLVKLATNISQAAQIADEKEKRAERKRRKENSDAVQIADEISPDISPESHRTFCPISPDISPLPILKNHEPSLEPSHVAGAPERAPGFREDYAQTTAPMSTPTPAVTKSRPLAESEVESILRAYPRKEAPVPARKAIRAQHALLMKGSVIKADGSTTPGMTSEEAAAYLLERTRAYAAHPKTLATLARDPKYIPYPATWFNRGSYTADEYGAEPTQATAIAPPRMSTVERARMQRERRSA